MKPYVICHMVASIDGRIDCSMVDKISGEEYYTALEQLDCPSPRDCLSRKSIPP